MMAPVGSVITPKRSPEMMVCAYVIRDVNTATMMTTAILKPKITVVSK